MVHPRSRSTTFWLMLRFRTTINGSSGPPAHVTRATLRDPCRCCLRQKVASQRVTSGELNHTNCPPANTAAQFHLRLPSLPACLPESLFAPPPSSHYFFFYLFRPLTKSNRSILHSILLKPHTRSRKAPSQPSWLPESSPGYPSLGSWFPRTPPRSALVAAIFRWERGGILG